MGLRQRLRHDKKLQDDFLRMILVQKEIDIAVGAAEPNAWLDFTYDGDVYVPRGFKLYFPSGSFKVTGRLRLKGTIVAYVPWDERKYPR